jgi:hypothetical protein
MAKKNNERYRICAVCGKRHGATFGFHHILRGLGIEGDKAVPACVIKAMKKAEDKRVKQGLRRIAR